MVDDGQTASRNRIPPLLDPQESCEAHKDHRGLLHRLKKLLSADLSEQESAEISLQLTRIRNRLKKKTKTAEQKKRELEQQKVYNQKSRAKKQAMEEEDKNKIEETSQVSVST